MVRGRALVNNSASGVCILLCVVATCVVNRVVRPVWSVELHIMQCNVNVEFKVTLHEQVRCRGTLQY